MLNFHSVNKLRAALALVSLMASPGAWAGACGRFELHAHRGAHDQPENSVPASLRAMELKFDAVELDLRLLKDNAWVLHHDPLVGRVVRPDLGEAISQKIKSPEALTSSAWANAQVLDRFGNPTRVPAPFLSDLLKVTAQRAGPAGRLNLEIKSKVSCDKLKALNAQVSSSLKPGTWMYSGIDLDTLACLRDANPSVYLGVVVGPEREASHLNIEKIQALAKRFSTRGEQMVADSSKAYEGMFNRQHLNENSIGLIAHQLSPMGFHVDSATLARVPNVLKYAHRQKAKVFSYSTQGTASHIANLSRLKAATGSLPDGMIIDGRQDQFCDKLRIISPS